MITVTIKDDSYTLSSSTNDDPTASELLKNFIGLMFTNSFTIGSIRRALVDNLESLKENIELANRKDD